MFYTDTPDNALRFGDIVQRYIISAPNIRQPSYETDFNIVVEKPKFCAVMSPCCSIGEKAIALSPLLPLQKNFWGNPYFKEDLTRINRRMLAEQSVTPEQWDKYSPEERQRRTEEGLQYALVELFIYENNELLPQYNLIRRGEEISTRQYMIDFRKIYRVNCDLIISAARSPLETKILQLSVEARKELREKIAYYFERIPAEDAPYLEEG